MVRWIILARFLGLWGSFDPLIAMKSSSFSLFVKAITNFGGQTGSACGGGGARASPLPEDDPPFLVSEVAADLWWGWGWSWWDGGRFSSAALSGDVIALTPPLDWALIVPEISEFLIKIQTHRKEKYSVSVYYLVSPKSYKIKEKRAQPHIHTHRLPKQKSLKTNLIKILKDYSLKKKKKKRN